MAFYLLKKIIFKKTNKNLSKFDYLLLDKNFAKKKY